MNERIKQLAEQAGFDYREHAYHINYLAELIVRECSNAVLSLPCYHRDYSNQIEPFVPCYYIDYRNAVINDCGRAVLEHFGVEE